MFVSAQKTGNSETMQRLRGTSQASDAADRSKAVPVIAGFGNRSGGQDGFHYSPQPIKKNYTNEEAAQAIRNVARLVTAASVRAAAEEVASVVYGMADEGKVSPNFRMPPAVAERVASQAEEARFAQVDIFAKLYPGGKNGWPTTEPLALLHSVGEKLSSMGSGDKAYGRTTEEWVKAAQKVLGSVALSVENFHKVRSLPP